MEKSLDIKIRNILADPSSNDFIIADASIETLEAKFYTWSANP